MTKHVSDPALFPVYGTDTGIPWSMIAPHRVQAFKNHAQSLEMLAQRGGLDWSELLAVLNDRPWRRVTEDEARRRVELSMGLSVQPKPTSDQSTAP